MAGMMNTTGMGRDEIIFICVLVVNALIALGYRVSCQFRKKERRGSCNLCCLVMLLCPVVGPCFFLLSWVVYRLFLHKPVDLADVIFSKERVKTYLKADENRESNFVPLEEAITVTDTNSTRELMMEVVRRDISGSLSTIALALNSGDSEVSHYAASVLQETMDKLRTDFQRRYRDIMDTEAELASLERDGQIIRTDMADGVEASDRRLAILRLRDAVRRRTGAAADTGDAADGSADAESGDVELYREEHVRERTAREAQAQALRAYAEAYGEEEDSVLERVRHEVEEARSLMDDIYKVLRQNVFSALEQSNYSQMLEELAEIVDRRDTMTAYELEEVALHELSMEKYDACARWCNREAALYPDALGSYTCRLKLAFAREDRETFFRILEELKKTDITLDHETLELVRAFG